MIFPKIVPPLIAILIFASEVDARRSYSIGKYGFYSTIFGTLAYLPNIKYKYNAGYASHFRILPGSGAYQLHKKQKYCFAINHYRPEPCKKTYLGVAIVSFMSDDHKEPTLVYYSSDWIRINDEKYNNRNGKQKLLKIRVNKFFKLHRIKDLNKFDKELGAKWHGKIKGTNIESWNKKYMWDLESELSEKHFQNNFDPPLTDIYKKRISALLISFITTNTKNTRRPLCFCFRSDSRYAVYLRIFVIDEFEMKYYITFK